MSTGTCNLCVKEFAKNVISRQFKKCLCAAPTRQEFLPVVNSPRVGKCGYTGNADFGDES
jgi:hypothetical protein